MDTLANSLLAWSIAGVPLTDFGFATRIRALSGEQLVVGNTELLKQPVKNFRRLHGPSRTEPCRAVPNPA